MRATNPYILTFLLLGTIACSKTDSTVGPSISPSPPTMTGRWIVTWTGWYDGYKGSTAGSMTLTEEDSALSGSISLRNQSFAVAGYLSSAREVVLTGSDNGYDYVIFGTVTSSKSTLNGQAYASHTGVVPQDLVGSATLIAYRH